MPSLCFDITLLILILSSSIMGFMRGFTREFFGAIGWIGATLITLYGFHFLYPVIANYSAIIWVRYVITGIALFLPSYIILRFFSSILSKLIKDSFLSSLDRTLGLGWGALRGLVLMCFLFLGTTYLYPNILSYFQEARTLPLVRTSSLILWSLIPNDFKATDLSKHLAEPAQASSEDRTKLLSSMSPNIDIKKKPL